MAEAAAPSRAAPDAGSPVSEEEVFDALLAVSLTDDTPAALVSASAQGALARLGQASNQTLVQRAVDMLSQHAKELAEQRERPNTLARRTALFRLLASIVRNQAPSAGARAGGVDVTDYVIEQVVNNLEWEQGVGDEEEDVESLRGAAEALLVQLAAHHMDAVLSRLLLRLDNACCLFQQQQGPAPGARSRLRPAMQWFAEKGAPADRRVAGLLAGIEALARGVPDVLAQHLKKVLAAMLPVISLSTSSSTKEAWSGAMCAYCEAVQAQNEEHRAAGRGALALAVDDSARMAMLAAFDVLALSWAASPDTVVQRCSFLSLAAMMCLLPPDDVRARLPQVISTLCQLLAVANTTMQVRVCLLDPALQRQLQALVRSLAAVLLISLEDAALPCSAARDCSHVVLPMGLTIMRAVLPAASRPAALSDKVQVGIFNDALQCFRLLAEVDAQPVVALLLSALTLDGQAVARPKGAAEMRQQQWGALALFAHLASRVPAALEASSSVVLTHAMIHCANSPDALVRVQLADLVMALAPLGYLHDDAASDVRGDCVRFLVASASACRADLRVAARMSAGGGVGWFGGRGGGSRDCAATRDAAFSAAQWWWPGGVSSRDGDGVARLQEALEQMRLVCGNGLYVLATKLPRPERLLWPGLLGFLVDARYSVALPVLCRAMAGLAVECESGVLAASLRAQDHSADASAERATERATDDATDNRGGVPRPSDILARILVAHAALADAGGVGAGAGAGARAHLVRGLMALSFLYPAPVADGIEQELPGLLESDAGESERCGGGAVRVANALRKCLQGAEEEFVVAVGEAIMAQRALYADDDAAASASASILLGSVLVAVRHDTRFVRVGLHQLLADTDHSTLLESEACALAFGTCAARHLSVTVEVLDDILKTRTVCDAAASIRERLAGWLGRVRLSTAASARDDDLARELGMASALLALAHVLISEGEKGVLIHTAMEVVPAEGAVLRHLGDILALAQPHLQPHKNIMGVGGVGAGLGVGDDIIDNARVVFVEFSVQALVRHEGMVAHDVLLRHVECVLSCVPWLIERCISSQSALQTLGEVTGVLRGGGHGGGQALERAKRLVRVCACVCKLQGVLMRPVDEAAKRVMDLGVCMRHFEQVLRVVDAAMALMAADGTPLPTQPQNERPDTAALATTLGDCCAGAVHNLCGSGGGAGMEASLALAVRVLQRLRSFSTGSCALGRARACSVLVRVLRAVPACGARQSQTREAGWGGEEVGTLAAFFVPRLADASASVREAAVEGLHVLMHLLGWKLETTAVGVDGGGAADGHGKPVIDEEEGDEERAVRVVGAQAGCVQSLFLFDLESVAVGVEELVRATGREVQAPCAHAAVAALTLILGMEDGQVGQKLHETNESECVGVSNMSSEGAAAMARDVIILGAGASVGSVQWRAAAMCVRVLMISHFEALAQYLLALELADGARAFALASLHGPAGLRGIPGGQERDYHVCVAKFVRYLGEVLSDSTRQDAAAVAAQAWRRHAAVDIQEGYVSFCDLAASVDAERKVVVGDGSVAEQVREGVRRQVVRLVKDLLVDPSWRRAVDPISMTVSLSVHLGALLLQRGGDGDGWGDSLWARPGSNAALEASACLAIVLRTARAQEAVSFLQRHEPAWATASESAGVAALHELSYEVFASTFARTPADYTKIANLLASVLGGPGAAGVARGSGGLPGLVPISDDFGDDEEEGQAGGGDATVRSSSLVCLAALSHAAAQHPPRNARTHGSGVEGFEYKPMASACDKAGAAGACDGDTLLHLTDLLLPHILPPPPPEGSSKTPRSRGTPRPCSPWPVSVVAAVVAAVPALAQSAQVLRQRGDKLLSALMRCCEGAEAHQWVAAPADPPAVADAPAMSLEHAAMLAEMTKRRQHDCERLVQEAAAAVAVLVRVLPSEQARGAAFSASEVSRAWFRAPAASLRVAAAEVALGVGAMMGSEGEGGPTGGEGGGGEEAARLREVGLDMLEEMVLGLGDGERAVRVACKRGVREVGLVLLGHHEDVTALLASSALDERWQTDVPGFVNSWLRLLHQHLPAALDGYASLVCSPVSARPPEAVSVVCVVAGALLRLRVRVDGVARALLGLLQHPEMPVRCAAASALQHFLPSPAPAETTQESRPVTAEPDDDIALRLQAHADLDAGNHALQARAFQDARLHFSRGLERGASVLAAETRAQLFCQRASACVGLGLWHDALVDACAGVSLVPGHVGGWLVKAAALEGLGRLQEARQVLLDANKLEHNNDKVAASLERVSYDILHASGTLRPETRGQGGERGGQEEGGQEPLSEMVQFIMGSEVKPSSSIRRFALPQQGAASAHDHGDRLLPSSGPAIQHHVRHGQDAAAGSHEGGRDVAGGSSDPPASPHSARSLQPIDPLPSLQQLQQADTPEQHAAVGVPTATEPSSAAQEASQATVGVPAAVDKTHTLQVMDRWLREEQEGDEKGADMAMETNVEMAQEEMAEMKQDKRSRKKEKKKKKDKPPG